MLRTIERHRDRVIERAIMPTTQWKPGELELPEVAVLRTGAQDEPV